MITRFILLFAFLLAPAVVQAASWAPDCKASDEPCKTFQKQLWDGKFEAIAAAAAPDAKYSEEARYYIGKAYLGLAGNEKNTPEQEEAYCRKALEYGQTQAYMGLYFLTADKDPKKALGYLREYVSTKPGDAVPYVILGESELEKGNYREADALLKESKKVGKARSSRVDWLLFQTNYLAKDYSFASEMLGNALQFGKFERELRELMADKRFEGIEDRPEFSRHRQVFIEAKPKT